MVLNNSCHYQRPFHDRFNVFRANALKAFEVEETMCRTDTISSFGFQSGDNADVSAGSVTFPMKLAESIELSRRSEREQKEAIIPDGQRARLEYEKRAAAPHLRQFADEVVSVRFLRGFDHLLLGNAVISVTDILAYCCVKEYRFLADHADVRAQPLNVQRRHVDPVQQDLHRKIWERLEIVSLPLYTHLCRANTLTFRGKRESIVRRNGELFAPFEKRHYYIIF